MCNLYRMTSNVEAMRRLFAAEGAPNLPLLDEIYPDRAAPVIRDADAGRIIDSMAWGFPPPAGAGRPVTNVRNLASPFWRTALSRPDRRCLVPVTAFSEWTQAPDPATGRKRKVWFALPDRPLFAFAGIWRPVEDGARFAFLTTEANATVGAVHPKAMPVILHEADHDAWLSADYAGACALARPYPDAEMTVVA